jgi:hypothetical protein
LRASSWARIFTLEKHLLFEITGLLGVGRAKPAGDRNQSAGYRAISQVALDHLALSLCLVLLLDIQFFGLSQIFTAVTAPTRFGGADQGEVALVSSMRHPEAERGISVARSCLIFAKAEGSALLRFGEHMPGSRAHVALKTSGADPSSSPSSTLKRRTMTARTRAGASRGDVLKPVP